MKLTILFSGVILTFTFFFTSTDKSVKYYPLLDVSSAQDSLKESMERGKEVYENFCTQCHLPTGEGVPGVYPPLAQADYLKKRSAAIYAVKFGLKGAITVNGQTYNSLMPPPGLYDNEVADVMNYILNTWGNKSEKMVTEKEVSAVEE